MKPPWGDLLARFPYLWTHAQETRDAALYGGGGRPYDSPRRSTAIPDPTARRAVSLVEANHSLNQLTHIRRWIDARLPAGDRVLLINVWRHRDAGWPVVAIYANMGVYECQERWNQLVADLNGWPGENGNRSRDRTLGPHYAGTACAPPSPVCVISPPNGGPG